MALSNITLRDIPQIVVSAIFLSIIPLFVLIFVLDKIDQSGKANASEVSAAVVPDKQSSAATDSSAMAAAGTEDGRDATLAVTDGADSSDNKYDKASSTGYNNMARYLAGLPQLYSNEWSACERFPSWQRYAETADKRWASLAENKFRKIVDFRDKELAGLDNQARTVFYPFSGPDFLHSCLFFPNAKEYIMIGLEKVGTMPSLRICSSDSLTARYIASVNRSLRDVLSLSFFITKKMKNDFGNNQLDGVLPTLMVFIVRTGNVILDVRYFGIGKDGAPEYRTEGRSEGASGVEILFKDRNNKLKKVQYMSVNLSDDGLKKNSPLMGYLKRFRSNTTYLKAASYLMHERYFATIRDYILGSSMMILQDDSGIPYRYFNRSSWNIKLYGSYSGPIGLFAGHRQKDLMDAYQKSSSIRTLDFGIGYKYRKGASNLLLAVKNINS